MTILAATTYLRNWFSNHETLTLNDDAKNDDFLKIVELSDSPDTDRAALHLALQEYENLSLIKKYKQDKKNYWVLSKPFNQINIQMNISMETAAFVCKALDNYREIIHEGENPMPISVPENISEIDIKSLAEICELMLDILENNEKGSKKKN